MRVSVAVDDLEPAIGGAGAAGDGVDGGGANGRRGRMGRGRVEDDDTPSNIGALQLGRARTVASSLDLRGARVDEALEALARYLDDASLAGLESARSSTGSGRARFVTPSEGRPPGIRW